jgi:hypothetical protein
MLKNQSSAQLLGGCVEELTLTTKMPGIQNNGYGDVIEVQDFL